MIKHHLRSTVPNTDVLNDWPSRRSALASARVFFTDLNGIRRVAGTKVWITYLRCLARQARTVLRKRSLIPVDKAMVQGTYIFSPTPRHQIIVDTTDFGADNVFSGAREMYCRQVYSTVPGFEVNVGDTVLDLGANIGLFSTMAAVQGARVIAVEAQSGFIPHIKANLTRNGVGDCVEVRLGLLGGDLGVLSSGAVAGSHWGDNPPALTIPQLISEFGLVKIDLIKADIEGSEFSLFTGELSWLSRVNKIVMEVHPPYGNPGTLVAVFEAHGFDVKLISNEGALVENIVASTGFLFARHLP